MRRRAALIPYAQHTLGRAEERAVLEVLRRGPLTQGPRVAALESAFAQRLGRRHAVAVSSGTAALHAAVQALRLPAGSEVITSPLTFAATANVLVHAGLVPRFCDVDPDSGVLTPQSVAAAINRRTSALLPVDYAGFPCDGRALRVLARRHHLALIEDSTHLLGGRQQGRPAGGWAHIAVFSLHPSKAIAAAEGGLVVTDSAELAGRVRRFREHGFVRSGSSSSAWQRELAEPGLNYRLSEIHAALAIVQLKRLDVFMRRRATIARRYLRQLGTLPHLDLPARPLRPGDTHAWHLFVVRLRPDRKGVSRARVLAELRRRGVGAQVHYRPVCAYRYYRQRWPRARTACPHAIAFAGRCLSLPLFPALQQHEQDHVVRTLESALLSSSP
ncbi:MAG: DegT/DnrJ/EryC1/StrS family aminotransferase [Acidobacteriota bacterium]